MLWWLCCSTRHISTCHLPLMSVLLYHCLLSHLGALISFSWSYFCSSCAVCDIIMMFDLQVNLQFIISSCTGSVPFVVYFFLPSCRSSCHPWTTLQCLVYYLCRPSLRLRSCWCRNAYLFRSDTCDKSVSTSAYIDMLQTSSSGNLKSSFA